MDENTGIGEITPDETDGAGEGTEDGVTETGGDNDNSDEDSAV